MSQPRSASASQNESSHTALEEEVLVIPTAYFHELGYFQGFSHEVARYLPHVFREDMVSFRPRRQVESDPSFKQLIPYVVLSHQDAAGRWQVFSYTRGKGQGESRLRTKRSVGIGGHVSRQDSAAAEDAFFKALKRELEEEVILGTAFRSECVGLINDDLTEVGRVHLGIVFRYHLADMVVTPRERDILGIGFAPAEELANNWEEFETWSQIVLEHVFGARPPR